MIFFYLTNILTPFFYYKNNNPFMNRIFLLLTHVTVYLATVFFTQKFLTKLPKNAASPAQKFNIPV